MTAAAFSVALALWALFASLRWATWRRRARLAAVAYFMRNHTARERIGDGMESTVVLDDLSARVLGENDLDKTHCYELFIDWEPRFWSAVKERNQ